MFICATILLTTLELHWNTECGPTDFDDFDDAESLNHTVPEEVVAARMKEKEQEEKPAPKKRSGRGSASQTSKTPGNAEAGSTRGATAPKDVPGQATVSSRPCPPLAYLLFVHSSLAGTGANDASDGARGPVC